MMSELFQCAQCCSHSNSINLPTESVVRLVNYEEPSGTGTTIQCARCCSQSRTGNNNQEPQNGQTTSSSVKATSIKRIERHVNIEKHIEWIKTRSSSSMHETNQAGLDSNKKSGDIVLNKTSTNTSMQRAIKEAGLYNQKKSGPTATTSTVSSLNVTNQTFTNNENQSAPTTVAIAKKTNDQTALNKQCESPSTSARYMKPTDKANLNNQKQIGPTATTSTISMNVTNQTVPNNENQSEPTAIATTTSISMKTVIQSVSNKQSESPSTSVTCMKPTDEADLNNQKKSEQTDATTSTMTALNNEKASESTATSSTDSGIELTGQIIRSEETLGEPSSTTSTSPNSSMDLTIEAVLIDHDYTNHKQSGTPTNSSTNPTNETVLNTLKVHGIAATIRWLISLQPPNVYNNSGAVRKSINMTKKRKALLQKSRRRAVDVELYDTFMQSQFRFPKSRTVKPTRAHPTLHAREATSVQQQNPRGHLSNFVETRSKAQQFGSEIERMSMVLQAKNEHIQKMEERFKEQNDKIEKMETQEKIFKYQNETKSAQIKRLSSQNRYYRKKAAKYEEKYQELAGQPRDEVEDPEEPEAVLERRQDKATLAERHRQIVELEYRIGILEEEQANNIVECYDEYKRKFNPEFKDCVNKLFDSNLALYQVAPCIEAVLDFAGKKANKLPCATTVKNIKIEREKEKAKREEDKHKQLQETIDCVVNSSVGVESSAPDPECGSSSSSSLESESESMPSPLEMEAVPESSPLDTEVVPESSPFEMEAVPESSPFAAV